MSEPTIDQMNEAIALFDGWERYEDRHGIWFKKEGLITALHPKLQDLEYHKSWNALMPVVAKIPKLVHATAELKLRREMSARWKPIENELCNINLINVHYCVYRFIQWYKQQSPAISKEDAERLIHLPEDKEPQGMPLPPKEPFQ